MHVVGTEWARRSGLLMNRVLRVGPGCLLKEPLLGSPGRGRGRGGGLLRLNVVVEKPGMLAMLMHVVLSLSPGDLRVRGQLSNAKQADIRQTFMAAKSSSSSLGRAPLMSGAAGMPTYL